MKNWDAEGIASVVNDFTIDCWKLRLTLLQLPTMIFRNPKKVCNAKTYIKVYFFANYGVTCNLRKKTFTSNK